MHLCWPIRAWLKHFFGGRLHCAIEYLRRNAVTSWLSLLQNGGMCETAAGQLTCVLSWQLWRMSVPRNLNLGDNAFFGAIPAALVEPQYLFCLDHNWTHVHVLGRECMYVYMHTYFFLGGGLPTVNHVFNLYIILLKHLRRRPWSEFSGSTNSFIQWIWHLRNRVHLKDFPGLGHQSSCRWWVAWMICPIF